MAMVEIAGSEKKPQHLPVGSLKVAGTNPYDEALFRVVWSESRTYLVGAKHTEYDGDPSKDSVIKRRGKDPNIRRSESAYKWLPLYPGLHAWVLEKWVSPFSATGMTPERYNELYKDPETGLLILGPYPSRGEYYHSHTFVGTPTISTILDQINKVRAGWNYTYNDHLVANRESMEKKEKDRGKIIKDMMLETKQAFNNNPSNVRPGKRTKKDIDFKLKAEQIRLNKGAFSTSSQKPTQ